MAEKDLHQKLRDWAYKTYGEVKLDARGAYVSGILKIMKLTMLAQYGEAGAPDWAVYVKAKVPKVFFMELKNPDGSGECSEKQLHYHAVLRAMGFDVYVVEDFLIGKSVIERQVKKAQGRPTRDPRRTPLNFGP